MILEKKATDFIDELSSAKPVPGGGGACAAVGALAAALGMMVGNLTVGKKRYADVEEEIKGALARLKELKNRLIELTDKDAECFEPLSRAYGLPKETIIEVMECLKLLEEKGSRLAVSDAGVGILFAQAALNGASLNVFINTKLMKDREKAQKLNGRADDLIQEGAAFQEKIYGEVLAKIR